MLLLLRFIIYKTLMDLKKVIGYDRFFVSN